MSRKLPPHIEWSRTANPNTCLGPFQSRRSTVYGTKGVVCSSQPLATEAGLEILRKGGNAVDAAVATSAALTVTEPGCCGIGGDAFCLFYDAKTKEVRALNGSGRAPARLTIDYLLSRGIKDRIPLTDLNSVTVPGAPAGWIDAVENFGSGSVTVADIFDPAIRLAEEGVPVSEIHSHAWQLSEDLLKQASPNGGDFLLDGKAPLPGQIMVFPKLATTFRELVSNGKDGFYKGRVAQAIVDLVKTKGGVMELDDLANHRSTFVKPINYTYAGDITVYECPPNGQGITALLALGILENIQEHGISRPLMDMEHNSPEYCHAVIEALRLAFADSRFFVTDPDFAETPVENLLNKDYLASRARLFDSKRTNPSVIHGSPTHSSDTVYLSVTDKWGNACSFIQSTGAIFGTGAIPEGCGFTLHSRGSYFSLTKNHPNALKGGKRPFHTISPVLVTRQDELFLCYGVMGGLMQPQGHVQVLLNILRGFTAQAALDAPRFCISAGLLDVGTRDTASGGGINSEIYFEDGFAENTITTLRSWSTIHFEYRIEIDDRCFIVAMGHDARIVTGFERSIVGRGQIIQKLKHPFGRQIWAAGSDPRADGHAAPQI